MSCPHGMGSWAACIDCQMEGPEPDAERKAKAPAAEWGPSTVAVHPGECPGCSLPIYMGQVIALNLATGRWHHWTPGTGPC